MVSAARRRSLMARRQRAQRSPAWISADGGIEAHAVTATARTTADSALIASSLLPGDPDCRADDTLEGARGRVPFDHDPGKRLQHGDSRAGADAERGEALGTRRPVALHAHESAGRAGRPGPQPL